MLKKIVTGFFIYIFIISVHFYLILSLYNNYNKDVVVKRILAEIQNNNLPDNQFQLSTSPFEKTFLEVKSSVTDGRVANLKAFFRKYNSPLYDYADVIVNESDRKGFDYRLLPAIAMQESNLCKVIPNNSYNCWGWGIYGDTVTRFSSYEEAIKTVAAGIKNHYLDKGLVTASMIMAKYTPSSNGSWARSVNYFLRALD